MAVTIITTDRPEGDVRILPQLGKVVMQRARLEGLLDAPATADDDLQKHSEPMTVPVPDANVLRIFIGRREEKTIEAEPSEPLTCLVAPYGGSDGQAPTPKDPGPGA